MLMPESTDQTDWNEARSDDCPCSNRFCCQKTSRRMFQRWCGRSELARKSDVCQPGPVDLRRRKRKSQSRRCNLWSRREFLSQVFRLNRCRWSLLRSRSSQTTSFCICKRVGWSFCPFAAASSGWAWRSFLDDTSTFSLAFEHCRCCRWCCLRSTCCIRSSKMTFSIHFLHNFSLQHKPKTVLNIFQLRVHVLTLRKLVSF